MTVEVTRSSVLTSITFHRLSFTVFSIKNISDSRLKFFSLHKICSVPSVVSTNGHVHTCMLAVCVCGCGAMEFQYSHLKSL